MARQDGVDLVEEVCPHLGPTEVQDELMAAEDRFVALGGERPLGMQSVQVASRG